MQGCRAHLEQHPGDFEALLLLSRACQAQGDFEAMLGAAEAAAKARPRNVEAQLRLAECRYYCSEVGAALDLVRHVEATAGSRYGALQRAAEFYVHCGQHEDAHRCHARAMELRPDDPVAVYKAASSSLSLGRIDQAEKLYERAIFLRPDDYDAWYNRSTLRRQAAGSHHVNELDYALERLPADHPGRVPLCFALAKELEDLEQYEASFHFLREGAEARRRRLDYDVAADERAMQTIATAFPAEALDAGPDGHDSPRPIFVLGLPRSGTTLVDRILSAHPQVASLGEINTLPFALMHTVGRHRGRDDLVRRSTACDHALLGQRYCRGLEGFGSDAPRLVDKTPANFLYLGLIRRALPNARVIHLRRNAVDSCYAMYKTLFRMGYPFSYSLQETGRYYIAYHRLMAHWRAAMPGFFLDVDYEDLVVNTRRQVQRMLDYLGLPFDEACLAPHRSEAPVATASAAQVRRPIHRESVGRWRYFKQHLAPLANKLNEAGIPI